jgi:hypothetical protein
LELNDAQEDPYQWHRWFAWYPVRIDGKLRWLVWTEVRQLYGDEAAHEIRMPHIMHTVLLPPAKAPLQIEHKPALAPASADDGEVKSRG